MFPKALGEIIVNHRSLQLPVSSVMAPAFPEAVGRFA